MSTTRDHLAMMTAYMWRRTLATLVATSSYVEDRSYGNSDILTLFPIDDFIPGRPTGTTKFLPQILDTGTEKFTQEIQLTSEAWFMRIEMHYLAGSMHTRVGTPGTENTHRRTSDLA